MMTKTEKKNNSSELRVKIRDKYYKFTFLQNIKYGEFMKVNLEEVNLNYVLHNLLFKCTKNNNEKSFELETGLIQESNNELQFIDYPPLAQNIPNEVKKYESIIKSYCKSVGLTLINEGLEAEIRDKLIIGLGNPSILETSLTLHHVYGVPYLPGQALKGIFRSYFQDEVMKVEDENQEVKLPNGKDMDKYRLYKKLFGEEYSSTGKKDEDKKENEVEKSAIIFFDAFPCINFKIEKDIISIHYKDYYDNKSVPPDGTEEPNVVRYYTVKEGKFKIFCALDQEKLENDCSNLKKFIQDKLKEALEEYGIGAKTSSGYGLFRVKEKKNSPFSGT